MVTQEKKTLDPHVLGVALLTLLAAAFRLPFLTHESLWKDELFSWQTISVNSLSEAIYRGAVVDTHPPLYTILSYGFKQILGVSEWGLRFPSALIGILCVPLIYLLGKELFGKREGLVAAAFMALLFRPIFFSLEARNNILVAFCAIIVGFVWLWTLRMVLENRKAPLLSIGLGVLAAMIAYTHYFGVLLLLVMMLHLAWRAMALRRGYLPVGLLGAGIAAAYLPWLAFAVQRVAETDQGFWIPKPDLLAPAWFFSFFFGRFHPLWMALALVVLAYLFLNKGPFKLAKPETEDPDMAREVRLMLAFWILAPFVIILGKSLVSTSFFLNRYFMICLPAAYLAAARGLNLLLQHPSRVAAATAAVVIVSLSHMFFIDRILERPQRAQYRQAIAYVERQVASQGELEPAPIFGSLAYLRYYTDREGSGMRMVASNQEYYLNTFPAYQEYIEEHRPDSFWLVQHYDEDDWTEERVDGPKARKMREKMTEHFAPDYVLAEHKNFREVLVMRFTRSSQ
jgi:mannosyltransferase